MQDQAGRTPTRWNKSGTVLKVLPHDSLLVKIDGSAKVTKRNRKFLRRFEPFAPQLSRPQTQPPPAVPWVPPPQQEPPVPKPTSTQELGPAPPLEIPTSQPHTPTDSSSQSSDFTPVQPQLTPVTPPFQSAHNQLAPPNPRHQSQLPKHLREKWIVYPVNTTPDPVAPLTNTNLAPIIYWPLTAMHGYPISSHLSAIPTSATTHEHTILPRPHYMPYPGNTTYSWSAQSLYTHGSAWPLGGGGHL